MSDGKNFYLGWAAGASGQIEIFYLLTKDDKGEYQLKYTPPFRTTIRPPVDTLPLGPGDLLNIDQSLNSLISTIKARSGEVSSGVVPPTEEAIQQMEDLGLLLYLAAIPESVQPDLRPSGLYLEFGVDELLLGYPWELMYDGEDFLCLKHNLGRFVNSKEQTPGRSRTETWFNTPIEKLSVLLVVVSQPQYKSDIYPPLPEAETEAAAVTKTLASIPDVELRVRSGRDATRNQIMKDLRSSKYHILHFCGHANFNDRDARNSSLVLHDTELTTGLVFSFISRKPPILCFINGCESAKVKAMDANTVITKNQFNVFYLAQAFLQTGTYLLGNRWKINDEVARTFGASFYESLLQKNQSLGEATRIARQACRDSAPGDFGWASYVLYGDPRMIFRPK